MNLPTYPASSEKPLRECLVCKEGQGVCNGETVEFHTPCAREAFIRCAPITLSGSPREQAEKFYGCLPWLLHRVGAEMRNVVLERVFFRDVQADFDVFAETRKEAYASVEIGEDEMPAASYIEQPPCRPDQAFELQLYVIVPKDNTRVRIESFPATEGGAMTKVVDIEGYKHLYITNINGMNGDGKPKPFRKQSDVMFEAGARLLQQHGTDFRKVLRTWCYLDDIDRDYAEFNLSRNVFFEHEHVKRLPASTGIRSGLHPQGTLCAFDMYALLNPEGAEVEVMHTPTLNEADEYGSAFSRGMKVALPDKTTLFISGTASIDEAGETVHLDDVRKQVERMLLNVKELLTHQGATFADVAQIITYLKSSSYIDLFQKIWDEWGLTGLPNTFVEAGVCRPELLCELEAIAILPMGPDGVVVSKSIQTESTSE
jgi:enamine deaminase RidA (YjgF/YER057c/UK114 family)